jgi:hypothetical protein
MSTAVDLVQAVWVPSASVVRGQLQPQAYGRKAVLMSINGPANSRLTIYRGHIPNFAGAVTSVFPADVRTYDAAGGAPIDIRPGEAATFDWSGGSAASGQTASCNIVWETYG